MNRTYNSTMIYKDALHKKLSGVCSGIARYYNKERWLVRALTLVALVIFPVATGVAYLVASILLPSR
ncbi:MAG: phage shock protein C [Alteromonadaceae bacterium]|jgi:phage shock protein C